MFHDSIAFLLSAKKPSSYIAQLVFIIITSNAYVHTDQT